MRAGGTAKPAGQRGIAERTPGAVEQRGRLIELAGLDRGGNEVGRGRFAPVVDGVIVRLGGRAGAGRARLLLRRSGLLPVPVVRGMVR